MNRESKISVGSIIFLVWILVTPCENQDIDLVQYVIEVSRTGNSFYPVDFYIEVYFSDFLT